MQFTKQSLAKFFKIFHKDLTASEASLLLQGKGEWSPTEESKKQMEKVRKYAWVFQLIPGLEAVFFCNTTAFRAADKSSDIDLFIVARDGQIWIVRTFVTVFLQLLGVRRHGNKIKDRFCLSFFATKTGVLNLKSLQIKEGKDPYLAAWCATAECFIARKDFLTEFYAANNWVGNYGLKFTQVVEPKRIHCWQLQLGSVLQLLGLEWLLRKLLLKRTQKKAECLKDTSGTIVSENYLKFHDKDARGKIAKQLMI